MAHIQSIRVVPPTFGEVAECILASLIQLSMKYKCSRIDFVTDRYLERSIKEVERSRRAASGTEEIHLFSKTQKTPKQWKKYLADSRNKTALVEFLFSVWCQGDFHATNDIQIYYAHGEVCHSLVVESGSLKIMTINELRCDHEESDTRMLLHAQHASENFQNVVIKSPDTDVAVTCLCLLSQLNANVHFYTGVGNKSRIINLKKVEEVIGPQTCQALVGLHTFTGCDSTSSFYGKGKKKTFRLLEDNGEFLEAFIELGKEFSVQESTFLKLEQFVCYLYGYQSSTKVNEVRYKVFYKIQKR